MNSNKNMFWKLEKMKLTALYTKNISGCRLGPPATLQTSTWTFSRRTSTTESSPTELSSGGPQIHQTAILWIIYSGTCHEPCVQGPAKDHGGPAELGQ